MPRFSAKKLKARIAQRIIIDSKTKCWLWQMYVGKENGYGQMWDGEKVRSAHAVSYVAYNGEVPDGLELDHLCRVRHCINPDHLEPVTRQVNLLRGLSIAAINAAKIECSRGHPLSGDNLYVARNGSRACRQCKRRSYNKWVSENRPRRREIDRQHYARSKQ